MANSAGDSWSDPKMFGRSGKFKNKQTNNRMSFYLEKDRPDVPRGEEEDFAFLDQPFPLDNCGCCAGEGDTGEESDGSAGWKDGLPRTYSKQQQERYKSEWIRYQSALDLRLRGADFVDTSEDGSTTQWGFCSKRARSGYWKVTRTKQSPAIPLEGVCFEQKSEDLYWQKAIKFLDDPIKNEYEIKVNVKQGLLSAGDIRVVAWLSEPTTGVDNSISDPTDPNFYNYVGMREYARLPVTGGTLSFKPSGIYKWLSFLAFNPDRGIEFDGSKWVYDGVWFSIKEPEQEITLEGF